MYHWPSGTYKQRNHWKSNKYTWLSKAGRTAEPVPTWTGVCLFCLFEIRAKEPNSFD